MKQLTVKGKLVELIGIDGSGKTTLGQKLQQILSQQGFSVVILNPVGEPDPFIQHIKHLSRQVNDLSLDKFIKDFMGNYCTFRLIERACYQITDLLSKHDCVICEKYLTMHLINQQYFKLDLEKYSSFFSFLPQPDLKIFLEIPKEEAQKRLASRANEFETHSFLSYCASSLRKLKENGQFSKIICAAQSEQKVLNEALVCIKEILT